MIHNFAVKNWEEINFMRLLNNEQYTFETIPLSKNNF